MVHLGLCLTSWLGVRVDVAVGRLRRAVRCRRLGEVGVVGSRRWHMRDFAFVGGWLAV